ncbi:hypothetical protein Dsin_028264 [Dipteronia sinensis]|uniref:Uncharacterized protein n=1 Tax=Dipteronia sinensis TaxID=43782 RepID=A0AAD9ZQB9_9ROSI|nr:hypothetical protein Dsin_028264 [Dipteronia sinensis]
MSDWSRRSSLVNSESEQGGGGGGAAALGFDRRRPTGLVLASNGRRLVSLLSLEGRYLLRTPLLLKLGIKVAFLSPSIEESTNIFRVEQDRLVVVA